MLAFDLTRMSTWTSLLWLSSLGLFCTSTSGCIGARMRDLQEQIDDSRAPDARRGVLALNSESQARLELLGRTSAPTRYAERTDANRLRVVAFDFGGAVLGQGADTAGNLLTFQCFIDPSDIEIVPTRPNEPPSPVPEKTAPLAKTVSKNSSAVDLDLYKGMFRQYSRQVGTTVETSADIGPVGSESRVFWSHNFLVLEWRRYRLKRIKQSNLCFGLPHVSAIEEGIAVRIVFDVRLRTVDAKLSAAFGIADLAVALARNEATVEASYELVGTRLDLLPHDAIIITSVNEYMNALKNFHAAVTTISDAWHDYNVHPLKPVISIGKDDKEGYNRTDLFAPDQLAYYVDGSGLGDTFLHLENVEVCQDLRSLRDHRATSIQRLQGNDGKPGEIRDVESNIREDAHRLRLARGEERGEIRSRLRDARAERTELHQELRRITKEHRELSTSYAKKNCGKTFESEQKRIDWICASREVAASRADKDKFSEIQQAMMYLGNYRCDTPSKGKEAAKKSISKALEAEDKKNLDENSP